MVGMYHSVLPTHPRKDSGLFLVWGYYKQSCYEYLCVGLYVN